MSRARFNIICLMPLLLLAIGPVHAERGDGRLIDGEVFFDPTRPLGAVRPTTDTAGVGNGGGLTLPLARRYRVSFIRAGGDRPVAVINNEQVTIGDQIAGATVTGIEPGAVSLRVNGEDRVINTWAGGIRESAEEH